MAEAPLAHVTLIRALERLRDASREAGARATARRGPRPPCPPRRAEALEEEAYAAVEIDARLGSSEDEDWKPFRLELSVRKGWHVNANPAGAGLVPRDGARASSAACASLRYPAGAAWDAGAGAVPVYTGRVVIEGEIERRGGGAAGVEVALPGLRRRALPPAGRTHRPAAVIPPRPEVARPLRLALRLASRRRRRAGLPDATARRGRERPSGAGARALRAQGRRDERGPRRAGARSRVRRRGLRVGARAGLARPHAGERGHPRAADEDAALQAARLLAEVGPRVQPLHVYAPLGLGRSLDHVLAYEAALRAFAGEAGPQSLSLRGAARGLRTGRGADAARAARGAAAAGGRQARRARQHRAPRLGRRRARAAARRERGDRGAARGPARDLAPAPARGAVEPAAGARAAAAPGRARGRRGGALARAGRRAGAAAEGPQGPARGARSASTLAPAPWRSSSAASITRSGSGCSCLRATACPRSSTRSRRDSGRSPVAIGALVALAVRAAGGGPEPASTCAVTSARGCWRRPTQICKSLRSR